ncbi:hypothetical protein ACQ86D_03430 [Streptomyces galilaeus]
MNTTGAVEVAVRHILGDKVSGGFLRPRTRTITWTDARYVVKRPTSGKNTVELTCPECSASLLAEVRDHSSTRTIASILRVLAVLCLVVFFAAFGYAIHEGGKTLPEGQSLPALFSVSVIAVFVTFVAGPVLFVRSLSYNGVSMLDAPKPRRRHGIMPVRKAPRGTRTPR